MYGELQFVYGKFTQASSQAHVQILFYFSYVYSLEGLYNIVY